MATPPTTNGTTSMTTLAPGTYELERQLRTLSLSGMAQTLLARKQEAISHHLAYTEFLELLVSDELARRRDRLFTRRLKAARVPQIKTLENFDWSFNPHIPKALILDLGTVRFIPAHGGLLLLGPPGTGKSHIALSLTVSAIQAGYTALYRSAFDLTQDLAQAEATGTRPELIRKLRGWTCWSSRTSACGACLPPQPRICWRSSPAAMNLAPFWSLPIGRWRTGARCWATPPQPAPC
jgi:DNA replication protein DnaC